MHARPASPGYWGERFSQSNPAVDAYELQINPNNESYFLPHPNGGYVQFENLVGSTVQDGKLVMSPSSIYHVGEKPPFLQQKILYEANRQVEAASAANMQVEWLISDERAACSIAELVSKSAKAIADFSHSSSSRGTMNMDILIPESQLAVSDTLLEHLEKIVPSVHWRELNEDVRLAYARYVALLNGNLRSEIYVGDLLDLDVFYNAYYWILVFAKRYQEQYGFDAGIEQETFKILERAPENVDWQIVESINEVSQQV